MKSVFYIMYLYTFLNALTLNFFWDIYKIEFVSHVKYDIWIFHYGEDLYCREENLMMEAIFYP
jgi:hypothetical protein